MRGFGPSAGHEPALGERLLLGHSCRRTRRVARANSVLVSRQPLFSAAERGCDRSDKLRFTFVISVTLGGWAARWCGMSTRRPLCRGGRIYLVGFSEFWESEDGSQRMRGR